MASDGLRAVKWGDTPPDAPREDTVTVQTTVTTVFPQDANRVQAVLVNDTSQTVRIGTDRTITTTRGIPVPPNGGTVILSYEEDGAAVQGTWFGIASASATIFRQQYRQPAIARRVA